MESSRQIEDTAAEWIVRRDSEEWTPDDDTQLAEWLSASNAHRVAFLRLEAAWEQTHRLQALGAGALRGTVPPVGAWRVSPFFEQRLPTTELESKPAAPRPASRKWSALTAGLLILLGVGAYTVSQLRGTRYTTPVGAIASIALEDGSNVTLNTASKVRVMLSEQHRLINLEGGEAFFDVAADRKRPFIVQAGKKRVVAVGTQFSVRRNGSDIQVIVSEGRVRLESSGPEAAGPASAAILTAGAVAHTADAKWVIRHKTAQDAVEALSWRTGYLTFDSLPLPEAVAEFNRYTSRKIVIRDPRVAALNVSGKFRAANAEAFVRVLRDGFGVQVRDAGDTIFLSGGPAPGALDDALQ
jgi:transmembrane sensor